MRWAKRWSRRLRALVRRDEVERELDEELAMHLELETEKNIRAGMSPEEARRQAAIAFGGVQKHREEVRDARWLGWLSGLSLDARLGVRMLVKYPGLTLVGGFGMAIAIAVAAIFDATIGAANSPMPIEGGERIVALEVWDAEINNQVTQLLYDYGTWEEELRSIESLGAHRTTTRNLIVPGGSTEPVLLAEMTASGFGMVGTPPLLGRPLVEADEAGDSPPVAVLSHYVWQSRFGGDPEVVGREMRLGTIVHTVVGVMPEGFGFPLNHKLWVPFRLHPAAYEPREGPAMYAFGRLAPGVSIEEAQAELTARGNSTAAAFPDTHRHLRPRVIQYGPHLMDLEGYEMPLMRGLITLLLIIIAVNVSVLVFARTVARAGEITVRSALGASRKRIVAQFLAEGVVLAAVSTVVGLTIAALSLRRLEQVMVAPLSYMGGLPFWMDFHLSAGSILFAVGLATLAAVIVGVVPALRATGMRLESALRTLGGATGMRLGRTWSFLIVTQVAFTVAILPGTMFFAVDFARYGMIDPGFAADDYLTTTLVMDREVRGEDVPLPEDEQEAFDDRYAALMGELERRLQSEPEVLAVAISSRVPSEEPIVRFELEGATAATGSLESALGHRARYNWIDRGFFDAFDVPVLSGRSFDGGDFSPAASVAVVNRAFVDEVVGGASVLGRRIRFAEGHRSGGIVRTPGGLEPERWYEIVGVVEDLPPVSMVDPDDPVAQVYRPLTPERGYPLSMSIHTRGAPTAFAPRVRELAAAVDPTLQTRNLQPLESVVRRVQGLMRMGALGLALLSGSVLLLSSAGIYALMSFTVTQRRREIGIRSALGANPRRVLASIFSRAAAQLGAGAALGLAFATWIDVITEGEMTGGAGGIVLPGVAVIILTVGLLAAWGPAWRGLRIQPMEALREE